jgi:hypothetical protein
MSPYFLRFVILWLVLQVSLISGRGTSNKDKISGRTAPSSTWSLSEDGRFSPETPLSVEGRRFPGAVLRSVLKDQLKIEKPDTNAVYIFLQFWPGAIWEDIVNGGKQ